MIRSVLIDAINMKWKFWPSLDIWYFIHLFSFCLRLYPKKNYIYTNMSNALNIKFKSLQQHCVDKRDRWKHSAIILINIRYRSKLGSRAKLVKSQLISFQFFSKKNSLNTFKFPFFAYLSSRLFPPLIATNFSCCIPSTKDHTKQYTILHIARRKFFKILC